MYESKPATWIQSTTKVAWFEFLLNPSLLEEHLSQSKPDPSATELIIQFLANSANSANEAANVATPGNSNQPGGSSQAFDKSGSNIPDEFPHESTQASKSEPENKKSQALKLLALKVAAFIKWDLNLLEKKLPLNMQQMLILEILKATGHEIDGLKVSHAISTNIAPVSQFARILFYTWILRAIVEGSYPARSQKGLNVQIPGQVDPSVISSNMIEAIMRKLQEETEQAVSALEEFLKKDCSVQMPVIGCFESVTEEVPNPVHKWEQGLMLKNDDVSCQVCYDLGRYYFYLEKYEMASAHFVRTSELYPKLYPPVFCQLNADKLKGFYGACAHLLGFQITDSTTSLKESLQTSVKSGHLHTVRILKSDNLKRELPIALRDSIEINILREQANQKNMAMCVTFLNAIRRTLDGKVVLTDCNSLLKINGEKGFSMLCELLKEVISSATPQQHQFLKNFLRMICFSNGLIKPSLKSVDIFNMLFTKEEIDELLKEGLQSSKSDSPKLEKSFNDDPLIQISVLERKLLFSREAPAIKLLITQLRAKGMTQSVCSINKKWEIPRAASIFLKNLPSHIDQETLYILMAKTAELRAIKKYSEARGLFRMIEKEMRNSAPRLSRILMWEVLRVDLLEVLDTPVYICYPSNLRAEIVQRVMACFSSFHLDRELPPDPQLLELCAAVLLNFREWDKLLEVDSRQEPYFELSRSLAAVCKDVFLNKNTRNIPREFWDMILPIFSNSVSSQLKRSSSGLLKEIPRETTHVIMNKHALQQFIRKLKDTLALGVMISCLSKLYNILKDDSTGEIFLEYQALWPGAVSNAVTFNMLAVGEAFQATLQYALSIHPTHSSWLRTKGDVMYVQGHYSAALKFYLSAAMVSTDFFNMSLPRVLFDDLQFKHMMHSCTKLQNYTQSAILHQFLDEPNYTAAFKALGERVCNDSCDVYYPCIWDVTFLEYLINLHTRRGEFERRQLALQLIGHLELNSNNNEEIQREAANIRKGRFLRAMAKQFL